MSDDDLLETARVAAERLARQLEADATEMHNGQALRRAAEAASGLSRVLDDDASAPGSAPLHCEPMSDPAHDPATDTLPPTLIVDVPASGDADRTPLPDAPPPAGPHVARAGSYFRNARYAITVMIVLAGAWFFYDGFYKWPEETRQYGELQAKIEAANERQDTAEVGRLSELQKGYKFHDAEGIRWNKGLGLILPPLGILLLARWLYISRGKFELDAGDVLHAPGHPPIPASDVTQIDDERWDKKGVAYLTADVGGGARRVKLDDFVYESGPMRRIHDRLAHLMKHPADGPSSR